MTKRLAAVLVSVLLLVGPVATAQLRPPGGPMRIVLLVDSSETVSTMINEFRAGLKGFLDALPGDPEIALVTSGSQLRIRVGPTTDRQKLYAAASGFAADGGGNTFLATLLEADNRLLKNTPDRRSVFVILTTDARVSLDDARIDLYNKFMAQFVARGGRAHGIIVQGINSGATSRLVENLVQNTNGFYETVTIASAVPKLMRTMAGYVAVDQ